MKPCLFLILPGLAFLSCHKSNSKEPSQLVAGVFQAQSWTGLGETTNPYFAKTITLQISVVSADTVSVHVNSVPYDYYSPGGDTLYPKAYVKANDNIAVVYLGQPNDPGTAENSIWFDTEGKAYYTYVPPGYTKGAVQTVFNKTN